MNNINLNNSISPGFTKFLRSIYHIICKRKGFRKFESDLQIQYYTSENQVNVEPCIITMIDGRGIHGGLSDRLRGLASVYAYCKKRDIKFYINHTYPFNLGDILQTNDYDWHIESDKISYNANEAVPVILNDYLLDSRFHKTYLDWCIKRHGNMQIHLYTNTDIYDADFSKSFRELFKPSILMQKVVSENVEAISSSYIGVVLRFQQLLGDFVEKGYDILEDQEKKALITKCLKKVIELKKYMSSDAKFLVTSDSKTFLNEVSKLDFVYTIPGTVVHMDHTDDADLSQYMKSFIDLYMLSKSDKIFLLKTDKMYQSGFAKRASMIENVEYKEILF